LNENYTIKFVSTVFGIERGQIIMSVVKFDYSKAKSFFSEHEVEYLKSSIEKSVENLMNGTGAGGD
jgi:hypothetical protein